MLNLRTELDAIASRPLCLVGLGHVGRGDDGLGVRLAEALRQRLAAGPGALTPGPHRIVLAGTEVERVVGSLAPHGCEQVLLVDAVDFGGAPGDVVWLDAAEIQARYPQVSTHRLSLGLWAKVLEAGGRRRVGLLGVQPGSLREGQEMSPPVRTTVRALAGLLADALGRAPAASPGRAWQPLEGSIGLDPAREVARC